MWGFDYLKVKESSLELSERWKERQECVVSKAYEEFQNGEISQVPSSGTVL